MKIRAFYGKVNKCGIGDVDCEIFEVRGMEYNDFLKKLKKSFAWFCKNEFLSGWATPFKPDDFVELEIFGIDEDAESETYILDDTLDHTFIFSKEDLKKGKFPY